MRNNENWFEMLKGVYSS